jgi:hypothetical protein
MLIRKRAARMEETEVFGDNDAELPDEENGSDIAA